MTRLRPHSVYTPPTDTGPTLGDAGREWTRTRVAYIVAAHPHKRPTHRTWSIPLPDGEGGQSSFRIGRFLHQIEPLYRRGEIGALGAPGKALGELPWFRAWMAELKAKRDRGPAGSLPDLEEEVVLLTEAFPTARPLRGATLEVVRRNGLRHTLVPRLVMERLAQQVAIDRPARACTLSPDAVEAFRALPWADAWLAQCQRARRVAGMRKVIPTATKVELLLCSCQVERPKCDTVVGVCGRGIEDVYTWRPYTWMDDIVNNWLTDGARPGVVLNAAQMGAIETLGWWRGWLGDVARARALRARALAAC